MKIRTRILLAFILVVGLAFAVLVRWIRDDLRPRYLQAMEESMVDLANLLAGVVSIELAEGDPGIGRVKRGLTTGMARNFEARIYEYTKTDVDVRVYVTDARGVVVFDSDGGKAEGEDYSRWNDVYLSLRGEYGARATRTDPTDPSSSTLYVGAPLRSAESIVGVLSVGKPTRNADQLIRAARTKILMAGICAAGVVVLISVAATAWITRPLDRLTAYAEAVRRGHRASMPDLGRSEIRAVGQAMEGMRIALEGKQYVEQYVQTLTHELKAPLTAIRGAVELMQEPDLDPARRRRFLHHLQSECERLRRIIDRQLLLTSLERRQALETVERVDLCGLVHDLVRAAGPVLERRRLAVEVTGPEVLFLEGDPFLLRHAVQNILHNAMDFSPDGGRIHLVLESDPDGPVLTCVDEGPGVPAYAVDRVFERFYSLPRPHTGAKSSGLGLPFVREVAILHGGTVSLANRPGGGVAVVLALGAFPSGVKTQN